MWIMLQMIRNLENKIKIMNQFVKILRTKIRKREMKTTKEADLKIKVMKRLLLNEIKLMKMLMMR